MDVRVGIKSPDTTAISPTGLAVPPERRRLSTDFGVKLDAAIFRCGRHSAVQRRIGAEPDRF